MEEDIIEFSYSGTDRDSGSSTTKIKEEITIIGLLNPKWEQTETLAQNIEANGYMGAASSLPLEDGGETMAPSNLQNSESCRPNFSSPNN